MHIFLTSIFAKIVLNPYICWRGYKALPAKRYLRIPFVLLFVVETLLLLTGVLFYKELPDDVFIPIMYICNTWFVAALYIAAILIPIDGLRLSNYLFRWFPRWIGENADKIQYTLLATIPLFVAGLLVYGYHIVMYPRVQHVHINIPKQVEGRDSLKMVMMTDLHFGEIIGKELAQRYVAMSNAENPDIVVLVGDIIDNESRFAEDAHIEEDLQQLKAPLGVYTVYGNHEYRANRHAKHKWLEKTGSTILVDSVAMPDSTFYLVGRDDFLNKKRKPLQALLEDVDMDKPVIVLEHQPWSLTELAMNNADLGLHGHTHNGQIWPYPILLKFIYENAYGYYRKGNTQYYVSSGIGLSGFPYRVGTVSEMVVLHITFREP
jgi:Predicted phosphohydrolases